MSLSKGARRRKKSPRRGVAMFEFAIVLPIFLLAIVGILEFGRAVMVQQILVNAAREGARRAVVPGAVGADITTWVRDDYLPGASLGAASRTAQILNGEGAETDLADINPHEVVRFRVTMPYDEVGVGISSWFTDWIMAADVQMRKE